MVVVLRATLTRFYRRLCGRFQREWIRHHHAALAAHLYPVVITVCIAVCICLNYFTRQRCRCQGAAHCKLARLDLHIIYALRYAAEEVVAVGVRQLVARAVVCRAQNAIRTCFDLHVVAGAFHTVRTYVPQFHRYAGNPRFACILHTVVVRGIHSRQVVRKHRRTDAHHRYQTEVNRHIAVVVVRIVLRSALTRLANRLCAR